MELSCQRWKPGTEEFVPHHVLADYIQDAAIENGVQASIQYDTRYCPVLTGEFCVTADVSSRVNSVQKQDAKWRLEIATLDNYARVLEHVEV